MSEPVAVGCYIFAGGFTLGVSKHFRVVSHLEESMYGVRSSLRNFPGLLAYTQPETWPLEDLAERGDIDFVFCNPPCAPWSQAGATMRGGNDAWKTDPRLRCWRNCFVAFEAIRPKVFAVESVVRALTAGKPMMNELTEMAHHMGYSVTYLLVDAKNHGMAQKRKRFFFIAHNVEVEFDRPRGDRVVVNDILPLVREPGYIPPWRDKTHEALIPFLPTHYSFRAIWEEYYDVSDRDVNAQGGVKGRPRIFIHRVDGDDLIGTITGDYFVHPTLDRFMGVNELKVLNGFPEDYWFEGHPAHHFSLMSRGVCPPVADWLAANIRRGIERDVSTQGETRLIDYR